MNTVLVSGMLRATGFALFFFLGGCVTVPGPGVAPQELKDAQEYYETKALRYSYDQVIRVRTVGEELTRALPASVQTSKTAPYAGLLLDEVTPVSAKVFDIQEFQTKKKACLIVGILPESPAAYAGLQPGDVIVKVNSQPVRNIHQTAVAFGKLDAGDDAYVTVDRGGEPFETVFRLVNKPYPVIFDVEDSEAVNAYAAPGQIFVTSGLLRFIQSDDELAIVLGHELAHLTRGHIAKGMAPNILAGLIGATAGTAVDILIPGAGDSIGRAAAAGVRPYSQDFEREADYVGLRYTYAAGYDIESAIGFWDRFATQLPKSISQSFFNTHPTSPERLLRIKKAIQQIKDEQDSSA